MSFLLPAAVMVFLIIIGFHEGWKKVLKFAAIFLGVVLISSAAITLMNLEINVMRIVGMVAWGIFLLWLIVYSLIKGYINRF